MLRASRQLHPSVTQLTLRGTLGQPFVALRDLKHHALCLKVCQQVSVHARLLSSLQPMLHVVEQRGGHLRRLILTCLCLGRSHPVAGI
jgi:hypothetical protein